MTRLALCAGCQAKHVPVDAPNRRCDDCRRQLNRTKYQRRRRTAAERKRRQALIAEPTRPSEYRPDRRPPDPAGSRRSTGERNPSAVPQLQRGSRRPAALQAVCLQRPDPWASVWNAPERRGGSACATLAAVVSIAALQPSEIAYVDQCLPLSRLDQQIEQGSTYLVAWDYDRPVGHAHIAWVGTHLGVPEIQDVFVLPERRRQGIGAQLTDAAEQEARTRGWESISLSVSQDGNLAARSLYTKLGYVDAGVDPVRLSGVITLRGRRFEVDDTLLYLTKPL